MPERLSRSPIKLYGGLPDAAMNGLAHLGGHFITSTGEEADDRYPTKKQTGTANHGTSM